MIWIVLSVALLALSAGFVLGVAYGISEEDRRARDRQRMLRSLKRMGHD